MFVYLQGWGVALKEGTAWWCVLVLLCEVGFVMCARKPVNGRGHRQYSMGLPYNKVVVVVVCVCVGGGGLIFA